MVNKRIQKYDTYTHTQNTYAFTRSPHGVMAKVLNCDLEVNEFELQSRYYVHFWTNTKRKGMKTAISKLCVK